MNRWTPPRNSGEISLVSTRFSLSTYGNEQRLTRDGTAEPVSRDQILRHERTRTEKCSIFLSAGHVQNWQPYPVEPYSCYICVTIHTKSKGSEVIVLNLLYNTVARSY